MRHRFAYEMPVRFADTDAQGHMFFANYFVFCDESLGAYMRAIGCPWQRLVAIDVDMFYVSAHCDFKGSAGFETVLAVHARISRFGTTSFDSEYAVFAPGGDEPIAVAKLTSVCVNPKTREPVPVPEILRAAVHRFEAATD